MRRLIIFAAALALGQIATAHELDQEAAMAPQDQVEHAKDLPGTLVLQINEKDPSKVTVFHLKDKIAPGTKLTGKQLEQLAVKAEERVAEVGDPKTELDRESSTSSWGFYFGSQFGRPYYRPAYHPYVGAFPGYGYGNWAYTRPYYPQPQYYAGYSYYPANYSYLGQCGSPCGAYAAPTYAYAGYDYAYAPYYSYTTPAYYSVPSYRYVYYNYSPCLY